MISPKLLLVLLSASMLPWVDSQRFDYFDLELARVISSNSNWNWVVSPTSIKTSLGLLLAGARNNTALEICYALRLPNDLGVARNSMHNFQQRLKGNQEGVKIKISNRIIVRKDAPLKQVYAINIEKAFGAKVATSDFSDPMRVSEEINKWVSRETDNYITKIVQPGDIKTNSLILVLNTVYFKGTWLQSFRPVSAPADTCFYTPSCKRVAMMTTTGYFKIGALPGLEARIIVLPYTNPRYSMLILLPHEQNGLKRLVYDLPFNSPLNLIDDLEESEVDFTMPKFTIKYGDNIIHDLRKLGIKDLFSEKADLSDLVAANVKVTSFIHEAKIEVNENGTIAGAATVSNAQLLSTMSKQRFVVNRPFFFMLRDKESGILFEGQVYDPPSREYGFPI